MYYACYLLGIRTADTLSRASNEERRKKGGGGERKKEGERREEERRRAKKKKMSRESEDHASRSLGKLVDSPSSFERRKRLLRLKKKLKVEKRSILRRFNRWT